MLCYNRNMQVRLFNLDNKKVELRKQNRGDWLKKGTRKKRQQRICPNVKFEIVIIKKMKVQVMDSATRWQIDGIC